MIVKGALQTCGMVTADMVNRHCIDEEIIADLQELIKSLPKYDNMRVREKLEKIVKKHE